MSARISVIGLLGAERVAALRAAGHTVTLDPTPEWELLDHDDLLVLALAPPEPTPWPFLRVLRERSTIPTLVVAPGLSTEEQRRLLGLGDVDYLDAAIGEAGFVAEVAAFLDHHPTLTIEVTRDLVPVA